MNAVDKMDELLKPYISDYQKRMEIITLLLSLVINEMDNK
jgi:hypothetical protein